MRKCRRGGKVNYQMDIFDFVPNPAKKKKTANPSEEAVAFKPLPKPPTEFSIYCGDVLARLKEIPDNSINTCITSPPYYGLRDYGTGIWEGGDPNCDHQDAKLSTRFERTMTEKSAKQTTNHGSDVKQYMRVCPTCGAKRVDYQIGMEETPDEFISRLVDVFREVKRVLRDDGVLWVNIGDSYNGSGKGRGSDGKTRTSATKSKIQHCNTGSIIGNIKKTDVAGLKPKDLIGIPWMLAFALRNDGWYLRQDIIWAKPNPMPESVRDRCTKSHEYIFMLTKNKKYYFDHDAVQEHATGYDGRRDIVLKGSTKYNNDEYLQNGSKRNTIASKGCERWRFKDGVPMRNKRDVWTVAVCSTVKEAHFAVFPKELIEPCIRAGCPEGGVVLDPFNGSGTTGIVAVENGRNYVGIELNPEYVEITKRRVEKECTNVSIVER